MQICKLIFPDLPTEKRYYLIYSYVFFFFFLEEEFISEVYEIN